MRCPDCAKFVSLEMGELEVDVDVAADDDGNGQVSGTVKVVLTCADCSQELKEASLEVDVLVDVAHDEGCQKDVELDLDFSPEPVDEFLPPNAKRQRHMYGAEGTIEVTCGCGAKGTADWKETVQSSHMDSLV